MELVLVDLAMDNSLSIQTSVFTTLMLTWQALGLSLLFFVD
jgi:hypothetical protein